MSIFPEENFLIYIYIKAQNTRERRPIRPIVLRNRLRQIAHGGDCKIKNRPMEL